jgi:cytochrome c oxidase cbb3-type subunit 3
MLRYSLRPLTPVCAGIFVVALAASVGAQRGPARPPQTTPPPVPTGTAAGADPREATARRLCIQCHPFENVVAIRRTRAQWEATVENMVGRGARGTAAEFSSVIDFLSEKYGLSGTVVRGAAGPDDKPLVDPKADELARPLWVADCQACHGADARGTPRGPNLVRSLVVLGDRYGKNIGPYLRSKHPPLPSGKILEPTDTQVLLFAHFLRARLNDTLRGSPLFRPGDILVGDAKAGADYFNGEGACTKCHSPTADLAGLASRITDPVNVQQRFLFPANAFGGRRGGAPPAPTGRPAPVVRVTVTPKSGPAVTGDLMLIDDFNVTLRAADGQPRSFRRGPDVTVVKDDPFAAHIALLVRITDTLFHDVVAYLWTLK